MRSIFLKSKDFLGDIARLMVFLVIKLMQLFFIIILIFYSLIFVLSNNSLERSLINSEANSIIYLFSLENSKNIS